MGFEFAPKCSAKVVPLQLHLTILLEKFGPMFDFMRYFLIFIMADCDSSKPHRHTGTQALSPAQLRQRRLREGAPFVCLVAGRKATNNGKGESQGPEPRAEQCSPRITKCKSLDEGWLHSRIII